MKRAKLHTEEDLKSFLKKADDETLENAYAFLQGMHFALELENDTERAKRLRRYFLRGLGAQEMLLIDRMAAAKAAAQDSKPPGPAEDMRTHTKP